MSKKYSKKVIAKIIETIENDGSLDSLYKSDPKVYPHRTTIFGWCKNDPEFNELYWEARKKQASAFVEKYNQMLKEQPESTGDKALDSHNVKLWDRQLRALEFKMLKLAKIFDSSIYNDKQTVQHEGLENVSGPQIMIMNYSTPQPKQISETIEHSPVNQLQGNIKED